MWEIFSMISNPPEYNFVQVLSPTFLFYRFICLQKEDDRTYD